jgi:predicted Mrr-cat superfamily restriction endonuclease
MGLHIGYKCKCQQNLVNYYESLDSETRALVPLSKVYWPIAE